MAGPRCSLVSVQTSIETSAPPQTPVVRRPNLPALTGIRAFLAVDIVFFHFSDPKWFGPLAPLVKGGYVGIGFFFLLSGFVLEYSHGGRTIKLREFWLARFARVYPVYMLALLVSIPMLMLEWQYQSRERFVLGALLTPLLLQGWHPVLATFWNTPAWTLSSEVAFYMLFPWLVRQRWPQQAGRLLLLLLGLWGAGMVLPLLYVWLRPDGLAEVNRYSYGIWLRALKFMPVEHVPAFVFGVVLARLHAVVELKPSQRLLIALAGLGGLSFVLYLGAGLPYVLLHEGLLMPVFGAITLGLAGENLVARFFGLPPFVLVGEASYCLYLLHFNLWTLLHDHGWLRRLHATALDPVFSYALLLATALASYQWLEVPARRRILAAGKRDA